VSSFSTWQLSLETRSLTELKDSARQELAHFPSYKWQGSTCLSPLLCLQYLVTAMPGCFIGTRDLLESIFLSSLYILDISPLSDLGLVKILSQSVGGLFVLLTVSFALQKLCNFLRSHLSILDLTAQAIAVLFRNFFPLCPYL
jgi:hypothetical protein